MDGHPPLAGPAGQLIGRDDDVEGLERLTDPYRSALSVALGLDHGSPPDQLMVSNAALALLVQAGAERPSLVIVDDLPWLDRASAVVMGFAARRLSGSRVGFLGAYRSEEEGFFDRGGVPTHHVRPLDAAAAEELVEDRFPSLVPRVRERLLAEAQGNPLALLQLPIALREQHAGAGMPEVLPLSRRLQAVAMGRGRFEDAYRHASAVSPAGELASHVPTALFLIMDLVEAAVRTGRHAARVATGPSRGRTAGTDRASGPRFRCRWMRRPRKSKRSSM